MPYRYFAVLVAVAAALAVVVYSLSVPDPILLDRAALLGESERDRVSEYHDYLLADHKIDYRVITTASDEPILEESVDLFEDLEIGSRSEWHRGLLLVINPRQEMVRMEVGFALESTFPDAFVGYIERDQMLPFFSDGRVADGILATTELIVDRAQRSAAQDEPGLDEIWIEGSGGAGAQSRAPIGTRPDTTLARDYDQPLDPAKSPIDALSAYFRAMESRNGSPDLAIYSTETQAMLSGRTVTPAQMDMVVRTYRECPPEPVRYSDSGKYAAIRYSADQRRCAPWFFLKEGEHWALDLRSMERAVQFGRTNAWHRSDKGFGRYAFAFDDWTFDENGFPF